MADYIFYVKVANSKFVLDSVSQATIALGHDITYRFDQSDSTNAGNTIAFSTTSDGTHNSGSAYTTGVTTTGTAGSSGAYVDIDVTSSTPASLYYYSAGNSGYGSAVITTGNTHVTTNNLGLLLPILADATDQWGSHINQSLRKIEDTFGANADVYTYNITGDTTAITGSATAGGTLAFNDGQHIEVYLNGVKLVGNLSSGNDYTLNASTDTITLASNAVNGDVVNVVVFKTFQFADAVPATGGTFSGDVAVNGDLTVDTDTLVVDSANNRVGIGKAVPETELDMGAGKIRLDNTKFIYWDDAGGTLRNAIRRNSNEMEYWSHPTDSGGQGTHQFKVGDTGGSTIDALKIDSSGNVGIGTTSPANPLHVETSGNTGIQIRSGTTTSNGFINFNDGATAKGQIFYDHNGDYMRMYVNGAERVRIDSSGNVELKTANRNLILPSGGGISFQNHSVSSATGASSTTSDNVLDDYEEGTWTPNPKGATTVGTYNVQLQSGKYRKVGSLVHCDAVIYVTSFTGTGQFRVDGLPFNVGSSSTGGLVLTQWNQSPFATFASDNQQVVGLAPANNDYIHFRACDRVYNGVYVQLQCNTSPSAITYLRLSFTYHTD